MIFLPQATISYPHAPAALGTLLVHALLALWLLLPASLPSVPPVAQQVLWISLFAPPALNAAPAPKMEAPARTETAKPRPAAKAAPARQAPAPRQQAEQLATLAPAAGKPSRQGVPDALPVTAPSFDAAYLRNPPPAYPASARRRGLEGNVLLEVLVSGAGDASSVKIARSSGVDVLDKAAQEAVEKWKFVPGRRGGEIMEARVMVPVEFRLER